MTTQPAKTPTRFASLRTKLLVGFWVLFTIVFAATYYWFYEFSRLTALRKIKDDQIATITGAAKQIDVEELMALYREGQPNAEGFSDDPRYERNLDLLAEIHEVEPRAWPGTYVLEGDNIVFLTDLWRRYDTAKAAGFKSVCEPATCADSPETLQAIIQAQNAVKLDQVEITTGVIRDQWGEWSGAWAPLKDKSGAVVGGMFLDFEAQYVRQVQDNVRNQIAFAAVVTYIVLLGSVYVISNNLTRPVVALTQAAARIGEGDYKQDLTNLAQGKLRDEINVLAEVFQIMVGKVHQREQTLIRQVEELKIEIDESRRKKQVSEIVDSEFFQDLQAKSRAMRRRRAGQEGSEPPPTPASA